MRIASNWKDFEVLDTSNGEKLERWGNITLVRPDPQVIWNTPKDSSWNKADAIYHRSKEGGGHWVFNKQLPNEWKINYKNLTFIVRPTGFKHTGLFPEQATNWDLMSDLIKNSKKPFKVLNLFAYTGGATLACAEAGAEVVHVDAAKGMVSWARENANASNLDSKPIRWIVDDCKKFIEREIRRGNKYQGIIMDPPSYGRGPNGEIWKLEDGIYDLCQLASQLLADDAVFFVLNSYTTGLSSAVTKALLEVTIKLKGEVTSSEIGLPVKKSGITLPEGSTAIWVGSTK